MGIWSHTFSAITANIFLRLLFPSTTKIGAVNSRAIATSQYNERAFADISQMSECVGGTPPAAMIDPMISRMVQRSILALKPEKPYNFRPSAKSHPIYDFRYQEKEALLLSSAAQGLDELPVDLCVSKHLKIVAKDHALDDIRLRLRRDGFDCAKAVGSAPTRMAGPRVFCRIRPEYQIMQVMV